MKLSARIRHRIRDHLDAMPAKPRQSSLAEAVGVTQSWVSHYLHGRHDIDLDTLEKLCDVLQLDLAALVKPDGQAKTTLRPELSELVALFQALAPDSQETVRQLLRELTRPAAQKRARSTR